MKMQVAFYKHMQEKRNFGVKKWVNKLIYLGLVSNSIWYAIILK